MRLLTPQVIQFLAQVFFTGLLIGLFRSAIPALAESEFNVPRDSYLILASFVLAFGIVKSYFNLKVGRWANCYGRKPLLLIGWAIAIPIPFILFYATSWWHIVGATTLLGVQQGLCWSISQISKLDITPSTQHSSIMGFNEFMGYIGVAIGGYLSAEVVILFGLQEGLMAMGVLIIALAMLLTVAVCEETIGYALTDHQRKTAKSQNYKALFAKVSVFNRSTSVICIGGLVEKFIDVLVWVVLPVYLYRKGVSLPLIGLITGTYAFTWGVVQLLPGILVKYIQLKSIINIGNVICGISAILFVLYDYDAWWFANAFLMGFGMGLLYPSLGTAISILCSSNVRAPVLGIYRFWRDFGYAVGSAVLGLSALIVGGFLHTFFVVGISMLIVGLIIQVNYSATNNKITTMD